MSKGGGSTRTISQSQIDWIHIEGEGEFVDDALDAVRNDRCTRSAIGRDLWFVADDIEAFDKEVRDVVTGNRRHGGGAHR